MSGSVTGRHDIQHNDTQLKEIQQKGLICDTQHNVFSVIMLCVVMLCRDYLNVMLSVIMLNFVRLNVVMLSVVAPCHRDLSDYYDLCGLCTILTTDI